MLETVRLLDEAECPGDLGAEEIQNCRYDHAFDLFPKAHEKVSCLFAAWNDESLCRIAMGYIAAARECAEGAKERKSAVSRLWRRPAVKFKDIVGLFAG